MPEIISRKEARALGLKRFFTGKPCPSGHISEGWVAGMSCIVCFRARALAVYYKNHEVRKKQLREHSAKRMQNNPEGERERIRAWYRANIDHARQKKREEFHRRKARDPDKLQEYVLKYTKAHRKEIAAKSRRWRLKNPEKIKEWALAWRKRNPDKVIESRNEYYRNGPPNPKDEKQWLRKNRAQLRQVKRYLKNPHRERSESSHKET